MGRLILLCAFLACLVLLGRLLFLNRQIRRLTEQTEAYLSTGGDPLDVALGEDRLSGLQNAIADLQQALARSRQLCVQECGRTSRLTADISHQLKTPLTTLRLYAEMDASPHMQASLEQIQRMEDLIQALLRLERLCADGYPFTFAPARAEAILEDQWEQLRPLWPGKTLVIEGAARIRCDSRWLGEAFLNLLKNACEHTPPHGEIRAVLERTEAVFFCTIEDNGGGVPAAELPKLFDRFYRAEHGSKNGAGIGLALVKEVIQRHHGVILAENGARGLKMTISMPMLDQALTNP